jgi:hypothetical protein
VLQSECSVVTNAIEARLNLDVLEADRRLETEERQRIALALPAPSGEAA